MAAQWRHCVANIEFNKRLQFAPAQLTAHALRSWTKKRWGLNPCGAKRLKIKRFMPVKERIAVRVSSEKIKLLLPAAAILLFVTTFAVMSLQLAVVLPFFHLDGAFQTASGLYRLDAGMMPGREFFPYLGIGPLFALYPFFKIAGANLAASAFGAQFLTLVVGSLTCGAIVFFMQKGKERSFVSALALGAAFFFLVLVVSKAIDLFIPEHPFLAFRSPGNSLKPLRAIAPTLIFCLYYAASVNVVQVYLRAVVFGLIAALALMWSNDFALPTVMGLVVHMIVFPQEDGKKFALRAYPVFALTAAGAYSLAITLSTQNSALKFIGYNFLDAARDQWWYFSSYEARDRVFGLLDSYKLLLSANAALSLLVLLYLGIQYLRFRERKMAILLSIGAVLVVGGVLPSVGGHLGDYFLAAGFWSYAILLYLIVTSAYRIFRQGRRLRYAQTLERYSGIFLVVGALGLLLAFSYQYNSTKRFAKLESEAGRLIYVGELGGYLDVEWSEYVEAARKSKPLHTIEEYWGIWSAVNRSFSAWPVDSTIHALGRVRAQAAAAIGTSDIIITTRGHLDMPAASDAPLSRIQKAAQAFELWQPWNLSQNFWLYGPLLEEWEPYAASPTTVLWRRSQGPSGAVSVPCRLGAKSDEFSLDGAAPGYYRVRIQYAVPDGGRKLIMVQSNISMVDGPEGFISVDPKGSEAEFPVYVPAEGRVGFSSAVRGPVGRDLRITACEAKTIPRRSPTLDRFYDLVIPRKTAVAAGHG